MTMKKNVNNIVTLGDWISATLECNGRRLAGIDGKNFASLEAVKRALLELAGSFVGMATLTVRNCTQGWRDVSALATMHRVPLRPQVAGVPGAGGQYLIPWAS